MVVSYIGLENMDENVLHVEVFKPDTGVEVKGVLQIVHGMTEHIGRYMEFAEKFCNNGYVVVGCDLSGHGRSVIVGESDKLYVNSWKVWIGDIKIVYDYIKSCYSELPVYILGFSLGSFVVRCMPLEWLDAYSKVILCGTGYTPSAVLSAISLVVRVCNLTNMDKISDMCRSICFDSYSKKFRGRDSLYWLLTDSEARHFYSVDPYVCRSFTPKFLVEFFECMKESNKFKVIKGKPYLFLSGSLDPVGENVDKVYKAFKKLSGVVSLYKFDGYTHDILHDVCYSAVAERVLSFIS